MKIQLDNAGKRYNRDWVFRNLSLHFETGTSYAITGPNGSGKSTLLQLLSGAISLNEGVCTYTFKGNALEPDKIYTHTSLCAPYLELVEEFTFLELLNFHQSFKPFINGFNADRIVETVSLSNAKHKKISEYSSGMKQRAKLAQCIFSDTEIVLLDEPCTNLDAAGIELYQSLIREFCMDRLLIVSSNDPVEYDFCQKIVDITAYK